MTSMKDASNAALDREFVVRAFTHMDIVEQLEPDDGLKEQILALSDEEMQTIAYRVAEQLNPEFWDLLEAVVRQHLQAPGE